MPEGLRHVYVTHHNEGVDAGGGEAVRVAEGSAGRCDLMTPGSGEPTIGGDDEGY
jgi:hypothetical protein